MIDLLQNFDVRETGNLELLARQVVEGFIIGLHKSPFHGFSVEFAEHRLYNQGDPLKNVDWKVFARTDKMFIKRYEEETNLRCQLVIDISSSMYFPEAPAKGKPMVNKLAWSILASASLMNLLMKQRDAFGMTLFADEIMDHTRAKSSTRHYNLLLSKLSQTLENASRNRVTDATKCLHQISESIHRRSLVIIFSDMFERPDQAEQLFSALQHLKHNKHEVVLFHVVDKRHEMEFEYENRPYLFIDMESGEKVRLQSNQVKDYYVEQMAKFKEALKLRCLQYKIDFVEADINGHFKQVLMSYLVKRTKMSV